MAEVDSSQGGKGRLGGTKGGAKTKKVSTKVDMTPMVDLAFLLITFFMLTTTFSKPKAMELNMPDKNKTDEKQLSKASESMTIILGKDNKVHWFVDTPQRALKGEIPVETTDFSPNGIRKAILEQTAKMGKDDKGINRIVIVIKPTDDSKYKNMVDMLDEMHITDSKRYAIVDLLPPEKELYTKIQNGGV